MRFFRNKGVFRQRFPSRTPFHTHGLPQLTVTSLGGPLRGFVVRFLGAFRRRPNTHVALSQGYQVYVNDRHRVHASYHLGPYVYQHGRRSFLYVGFPRDGHFFHCIFREGYQGTYKRLREVPFFLLVSRYLWFRPIGGNELFQVYLSFLGVAQFPIPSVLPQECPRRLFSSPSLPISSRYGQ